MQFFLEKWRQNLCRQFWLGLFHFMPQIKCLFRLKNAFFPRSWPSHIFVKNLSLSDVQLVSLWHNKTASQFRQYLRLQFSHTLVYDLCARHRRWRENRIDKAYKLDPAKLGCFALYDVNKPVFLKRAIRTNSTPQPSQSDLLWSTHAP